MGIATAIAVGAGVAAVGGSIASGIGAKKAAKKANQQNLARAREQNNKDMERFLLTRGAEGNAILPTFLQTAEGKPFEGEVLGQNLVDLYGASRRFDTFEEEIAANQDEINRLQPTIDAATGQVVGLFDGTLKQRALDNVAPVQAAQQEAVRNSTATSLQEQLARQAALNQRRGIGVDTQSDRLTRARMLREQAGLIASGEINNMRENAGIRQRYDDLLFQNIGLPDRQAEASIKRSSMAQRSAIDEQSNRMAPFQFFNIGPGQAPAYRLPTFQQEPNGLMIAGQGLSAAGNFGSGLLKSGLFNKPGAGSVTPEPGTFSPYPAAPTPQVPYYIAKPPAAPFANYGSNLGSYGYTNYGMIPR